MLFWALPFLGRVVPYIFGKGVVPYIFGRVVGCKGGPLYIWSRRAREAFGTTSSAMLHYATFLWNEGDVCTTNREFENRHRDHHAEEQESPAERNAQQG